MRILHGMALAVLLPCVVNCAGTTDPSGSGGCRPLKLTIVNGPAPEFRWEPSGCAVYSLSLWKPNLADTGWQLSSIAYKNTIESPVRYGVTQPGAYGSPAERFHGGPYRLIIVRLDGSPTGIVADTTFNAP